MKPLNALSWRHHGVGLLLAAAWFTVLVQTSGQVGIPRDESFYFDAADNAAKWVERLGDPEVASFSKEEIERWFRYNREHPMLMKFLFGISHRWIGEKWGWVDDHITAYRLPTMLMAALAVWLAFLIGVMVQGPAAGAVAALALAFQPHAYFHSHLACFDAPVTFTWLLVCYTFLRATRSRRWAIACGISLGLGLATKLNMFFVPFVLLGVAALDVWAWKQRTGAWRAPAGERGPLTYYAWIAGSMVVLGLAVFLAHWPWLYHDTFKRLGAYYAFHAKHEHYPVDYLGHLYYEPPFPVHFPFVFSFLTLPVALMVLGAIGTAVTVKRALRQLHPREEADRTDRRGADVWLLANLLVPFLVIAWPTTPIFGGTKHWMPAMPFLAVLAGIGAVRLGEGLWRHAAPARQHLLGAALGAVMLVPAAWSTFVYGPHGAAWYNEIAGGPPGAAELGMPRNFWGYSTNEVLPWINEHVEQRGLVFWHKATLGAIRAYQRDGLLRPDVQYTGDWTAAYSNWAVHHDQLEKLPEELDIWRAYGTEWPVAGFFLDGVQLVPVYERPAAPAAPPVPAGGR